MSRLFGLLVAVAVAHAQTAVRTALLVIDIQNDFMPPSGSLAVNDAFAAVDVINQLRTKVDFDLTVFTQDWHPADHISFYVNNKDVPGAALFHPTYLPRCNCTQMLWPVHCVQGSQGAEFSPALIRRSTDIIVQKGMNPNIDSYSGFYDNGHLSQTPMNDILQANNITTVYVTGVALDYCVAYTSLDARELGYDTYVVVDAARGVNADSIATMMDRMKAAGVKPIPSSVLLGMN